MATRMLSKNSYLTSRFTARLQYQLLIPRSAKTRSLDEAKQLHAQAITFGALLPQMQSIIRGTHGTHDCSQLYEEFHNQNLLSWNSLMKMYSHADSPGHALYLFTKMLANGQNRPDNYTYLFAIKACGDMSMPGTGESLHAMSLLSGFRSDIWVQNSLLAMYMNFGEKRSAKNIFDAMTRRTMTSWNTMIHGYYRNGCAENALTIFESMKSAGVEPDSVTVVSILPVCGYLKELEKGRKIHAYIGEKGLGDKISVWNAVVDMYAKCGSMDEAKKVFIRMDKRNVVSWTTLICGHILNGDAAHALELCSVMHSEGVRPSSVTVASLLSACASLHNLRLGKPLHGWALRHNVNSDVVVETALVDMYSKCNCSRFGSRLFSEASRNQTSPWNAALSGCVRNGHAKKAIRLFKKMLKEGIELDVATLGSLLPASADLAEISQAENIHSFVLKSGFSSSIEVATSLMDVYSKCGGLVLVHKIFNGIEKNYKDVYIWTVVIVSYGMYGIGKVAVSLFSAMVVSGVQPNEVTFTTVLHACSHGGLVDEGLVLFTFMIRYHEALLNYDHCSCMVDLLGRSGRLHEAYELIKMMPFRANHAVWGALLGGCVIHENVELGEKAAYWLFENEPENTGNYVQLAKIYAAAGKWKEAEHVRGVLNEIGLRKCPAHSKLR